MIWGSFFVFLGPGSMGMTQKIRFRPMFIGIGPIFGISNFCIMVGVGTLLFWRSRRVRGGLERPGLLGEVSGRVPAHLGAVLE